MFDETEVRHLISQGALVRAALRLSDHLDLVPNDIAALKLCAEVEFRRGRRETGFEAAMRAVDLNPDDIDYGLDCAFNLVRSGRRDEALVIADKIVERALPSAEHYDALGTVYTQCECPDRAIRAFEEACHAEPQSPRYRHHLANVQRMLGDIDAAEANLDQAIALDDTQGDFYLSRAQLRRQTPTRNHIDELKHALRRVGSGEARIPLDYALAKELEDVGEFAEAFRYLSAASALQRSLVRYDAAQEFALMRSLRDLEYPIPSPSPVRHSDAAGPIFIFGLPRSGTTLVERIVASSGQAVSAGETNRLSAELWRAATRGGRPANLNGAIIQAAADQGRTIGSAYLDAVGKRFEGARFIDKTPSNYLFAGLIRAHVPGARIICLRRAPMDSCYAMYKTLFSGAYPFTYDQRELASYYVEWDRLISHWEATLGEAWLSVGYEDVIGDAETVMRRIIAHCHLEWDERCLDFHRFAAPVTSASAGQVSQPLNNRSIGLWRQYEDELSILAGALEDAGIDIGR